MVSTLLLIAAGPDDSLSSPQQQQSTANSTKIAYALPCYARTSRRMSTVNTRPFLVSSGAQQFSTSTDRHEASTMSRRRAFTAGVRGRSASGPRGRRTSSARSLPIPAVHSPRNRIRSSILMTSKVNMMPEAAEKRGKSIGEAAGTKPSTCGSSSKQILVVRKPAAIVNDATRRRPTAKHASAHVSRRGSTMKEVLEQNTKHHQQSMGLVDENNSIQSERQQRRNRGLNLR